VVRFNLGLEPAPLPKDVSPPVETKTLAAVSH
jgi:hypothetical protein